MGWLNTRADIINVILSKKVWERSRSRLLAPVTLSYILLLLYQVRCINKITISLYIIEVGNNYMTYGFILKSYYY